MIGTFAQHVKLAADELRFWQGFVRSDRFLQGGVPPIRTPELRDEVFKYIWDRPKAEVLDVGSGVVSILRGTVPDCLLTAADPLSPLYELIFDYRGHGISPPVACAVEELPYEHSFDIVHISNALDHCQDPAQGMKALWRAVRPGGALIVCGFIDEALQQHRTGMHQWNFDVEGKELRLWDGKKQKKVAWWEGSIAFPEVLCTGRRWLVWIKEA